MKKRHFQIKLSRYISIITSMPIVLMGLLLITIMITQFNDTVEQIESTHAQHEIDYMRSTIVSFLDVRKTALADMAKHPIIVQSVLHPKNNYDNIKDFLDGLLILNKDYNTSLLDFQGNVLYSETPAILESISKQTWLEKVLTGQMESYIGTVEDNLYWWIIAVPVEYNDSVEGVLLAKIPIADIFENSEIAAMPDGLKIELYSGPKKIISIGEEVSGHPKTENIPSMGITITYTIDHSDADTMINSMVKNLLVTIIFFTIITIILLVYSGKKFISNPVNEIREMAVKLTDGDRNSIAFKESRILELQALKQQFIDMSNKIDDRENALLIANEDLENKHEELKNAISKLENAQSQMIQQEKLASIGHLAAGVAHELNNPIGFVSSNFEVLKDYFEELSDYLVQSEATELSDKLQFVIEDVPELIADSQEGLNRVTAIVKNLRDFSRIDNFERSDYNLNDGIKSTLIVAKNEYKYVSEVETEFGSIPDINAKGSEINDVLLNLIINATHAIASMNLDTKGTIKIKTYSDTNYVSVDIADDGPGIPEDVIGRIFDPFFTTKEPGQGTGLGLNIAYNTIVKKHNGLLIVESKPGEGARFTVRLPVDASKPLPRQSIEPL